MEGGWFLGLQNLECSYIIWGFFVVEVLWQMSGEVVLDYFGFEFGIE